MRRKKWEVSSLVTLLFSVNDRILREICESQTSVISVPDLALADREIYRARVLKTHKGRHKTRAIKVIWSFIHILKRMWGLPVRWRRLDTKVKCPTRRVSFWVKFPTVRSLTRVKCPGIAPGGGMGGFGIDWYIIDMLLNTERSYKRQGHTPFKHFVGFLCNGGKPE